MLWGELKRIFTKLPILILLLVILPVFAVSAIITGIKSPSTPSALSYEPLEVWQDRLSDLERVVDHDGEEFETSLFVAFREFTETWDTFVNHDYPSTAGGWTTLRNSFCEMITAYQDFETIANASFTGASNVMITSGNFKTVQKGMQEFKRILITPNYNVNALSDLDLWNVVVEVRRELESAEGYAVDMLAILSNTKSIVFDWDERRELEEHLDKAIAYVESAEGEQQRTEFLIVACEYIELHIQLVQARHTGNITRFRGFASFNRPATKDRLAVLGVLIDEQKSIFDYSTPYKYGSILHEPTGTSGMDFVFNNLELISIPLIILACLVVVFCIFYDIKKDTIIGSLVGPKSRRQVLTAKLLACTIAIALIIGIFGILFFLTATIITGTATAPTILTAFGGTAIKISPCLLLMVYLLSLFFKMLFFASITALICINAKSIIPILIIVGSIIAAIILLNVFFTIVWPFVFYQHLPFIALDFAGFFGIGFMLSNHLASTFIWFTLPVMIIIWCVIIGATYRRFNRRDF